MLPSIITANVLLVWFCFGFFAGLGWGLASFLISRSLGRWWA